VEKAALVGIRIIDFTQFWAGPYAVTLLSFMGAEVIKVESHKRFDPSRTRSLTTGQKFSNIEQSPVYNEISLNRLGITLDLTQPRAVELAKRLLALCDVLAQNFRPGVMDKLGLGYEAVKKVRPDIVYLSSSALGAEGPERYYTGYAPGFASLGGLAHITGYPDGPPYAMTGRIDLISATTSAFAMLVALNHRLRTGQGQHIDLSSSESISVLIGDVLMDYTINRRVQTRQGNRDEVLAPHNCYPCQGKDEWVSIAVGTEEEWQALCRVMAHPEWLQDERFADAYSRWQHQEQLDRLIAQWTRLRTKFEATELLQGAGVAAFPSMRSQDFFNDAHLRERDFATTVVHPVVGKQTLLRPPWRFSETPPRVYRHGPLLGQHNEYVFGELLGISSKEFAQLQEEGVIH